MPAVNLSPLFNDAQLDADGNPAVGYKIFTYAAGSSTKQVSYTDSGGTVAQTNPILLNARGEPPDGPIWLADGLSYKFLLSSPTDTDPPTSPVRTVDNILGINDTTSPPASEWLSSGLIPTYVTANSFTLPGDQTTEFHVGRRLKLTLTAGTLYGSIISSVYVTLTTVTVELDSGVLDPGLSAVALGLLSATNPSLPFVSRTQHCGRLNRITATQIRLDPEGGNTIWIYTGGAWRLRQIPAAGITAANTNTFLDGIGGANLAALSTYYVYIFDNAGTLTVDFSTAAYAIDSTSGLKVKLGAPSRLLVGMVRTDALNQFQLAVSYYRRRMRLAQGVLPVGTATGSTSMVELHGSLRTEFLCWRGEAISISFNGWGSQSIKDAAMYTNITYDGILNVIAVLNVNVPEMDHAQNLSFGAMSELAEGYHYLTIAVGVSVGIGSWSSGALACMTMG